jgi:hypothetical protein
MESYIQYASGYQKDNIIFDDIKQAISDVQKMDDEHGAFWASVITDDENVIETNKDLQLSIIFDGEETKYKANDWNEVESFYRLLLEKRFDEIKEKIK